MEEIISSAQLHSFDLECFPKEATQRSGYTDTADVIVKGV